MTFWDKLLPPPADKKYHFIAGFIISFSITSFTNNSNIGNLVSFIAGGGKEYYDYKNPDKHNTELTDWAYTCFGGLCGSLVSTLLFLLIG